MKVVIITRNSCSIKCSSLSTSADIRQLDHVHIYSFIQVKSINTIAEADAPLLISHTFCAA